LCGFEGRSRADGSNGRHTTCSPSSSDHQSLLQYYGITYNPPPYPQGLAVSFIQFSTLASYTSKPTQSHELDASFNRKVDENLAEDDRQSEHYYYPDRQPISLVDHHVHTQTPVSFRGLSYRPTRDNQTPPDHHPHHPITETYHFKGHGAQEKSLPNASINRRHHLHANPLLFHLNPFFSLRA
jgi:hypothetical protein